VRKGGLEPPCLSAPPPQDGVSANFTTSALQNFLAFNYLINAFLRVRSTASDVALIRCALIPHPGFIAIHVRQADKQF
jgi:hypothetical protein